MADLDRYVDGVWCRLHRISGETVLELRDPNDGQGSDPETKSRYQYRVVHGLLLRRVLPPATVGDRFLGDEIDDPWWEPVLELPPGGPLRAYYEQHDHAVQLHQYAWQARYTAGHVVAYAPNGREVRYAKRGGLEVQPRNDNCWIPCADLPAARRAYYGASDAR